MNIKTEQPLTASQKFLIGTGVTLAIVGVYFNYFDKVTQAASTYGIAMVFLCFAFIDKIKSFKGPGFEFIAKTAEERQKELADDFEAERSAERVEKQGHPLVIPNDLSSYLSATNKAVALIKNKYPDGQLRIDNKVLLRNRVISTDGFIKLEDKDVFIEVKISKLQQPPINFLLQSLKQYLSKIGEYSELAKRQVLLEFVLIGEIDQSVRDKINDFPRQLNKYSVPVNITFISFTELGMPMPTNIETPRT